MLNSNVSITWPTWEGDGVDLTQLEHELYRYLLDNVGRTVTYYEIALQIWGEGAFAERGIKSRIYQLVARLRRKLEDDPGRMLRIRTVHGRGYKPHTNGRGR